MRCRSILACAAAAPLLIAAVQPVRLQPSSPWDVDYATNSCRLMRIFGAGRNQVSLEFQSPAPGEMDLLVEGKPLSGYSDKVPAVFLPVGGKPMEGTAVKTASAGDPAVLWSNVPMLPADAAAKIKAEEEELHRHPGVRPPAISLAERMANQAQRQQFTRTATELEITTRSDRPVILETGSLGDAMAALDRCGQDSLKDWGVDPKIEAKIVRPVWPSNVDRWLSSSDYPSDMMQLGEESEVDVRLLVNAAGKVTKCTSLSHFDAPEFNRISCELIARRARFKPAELADGTKVPSYYEQRVIFRVR